MFDHSWADAYYRFGYQYYPKLQSCVPFTPVTGQRILVRDAWYKDQVIDMLISALKDLALKVENFPTSKLPRSLIMANRILLVNEIFNRYLRLLLSIFVQLQVSSLHVTFPTETECQRMKKDGFLQRTGMQYHWKNRNYKKLALKTLILFLVYFEIFKQIYIAMSQ